MQLCSHDARLMVTDPLLMLLRTNARYTNDQLSELLSLSQEEVAARISAFEKDGTIKGYQVVVDPELAGDKDVNAFIEVKLCPERGDGFDRLANRIARFDQVNSCYLASGSYDLLLEVEGNSLRDVAAFVSQKLSTMNGVLSTATLFRLKVYKQNGLLMRTEETDGRLAVSP